ncbi:MAG: hypothetical protein HY830_04610 [Actinobacteria bacterium]|nr:hypothetical protein [Actinomycetota bacterium]
MTDRSTKDGDADHLHDDLMREYYQLVDIVAGFDQRLLTVKSWGVTFALATLGLGFQQDHYGLFLVAAAGGLAFWLIEASIKTHQMRYYPRMGDIEVIAHTLYSRELPDGTRASAPLIDWSWFTARPRVRGGQSKGDPRTPHAWADINTDPGRNRAVLLYPHVALPHAIAVLLGVVLFVLGLGGAFGPI